MTRILTSLAALVAVAIVATAGLAATASGPNDRVAPMTTGGQLYVDGAGYVRIRGSFLAFGDVGGMTVTVTDHAGNARVILAGKRLRFPRRPTQARGGPSHITFRPASRNILSLDGTNIVAEFRGSGNVTLSITGNGTARLDGVGTFRQNTRGTESWPLRPIDLPLRATRRTGQG
ncbi:MAG: hypothetical protein EXQ74_01005 [Thermoleophilia bacterium]|nr:hypothetical protein [Thermoleophilia bacterium]